MKSKIEKFGFNKDPLIKSYEEIKLESKINEIIDHLNSQDQEEMWETPEVELEEGTIIDTPDGKRKIGKTHTSKDTSEEWEEKFHKEFGEIGGVIDENNDLQLVAYMSENIKNFIKQLLEEKEKEVLEDMKKWNIEYYKKKHWILDLDAEKAIQKFVKKRLDNLNNKKK